MQCLQAKDKNKKTSRFVFLLSIFFNSLPIIVQYSFYYGEIIIPLHKLVSFQSDMIRNFQLLSKWSVVWFPFISDTEGEDVRERGTVLHEAFHIRKWVLKLISNWEKS